MIQLLINKSNENKELAVVMRYRRVILRHRSSNSFPLRFPLNFFVVQFLFAWLSPYQRKTFSRYYNRRCVTLPHCRLSLFLSLSRIAITDKRGLKIEPPQLQIKYVIETYHCFSIKWKYTDFFNEIVYFISSISSIGLGRVELKI